MYQFNKIIDLAIKLNKYDDTFKYIQLAKSRSLSERIFIDNLLPQGIPKHLQKKYDKFRNIKERLTSAILNSNKSETRKYIGKWFTACKSYRALMEEIQKNDPEFVNLVNSPEISPSTLNEALQKCPQGTLLIETFITYTQIICILISPGINVSESFISTTEINIKSLSNTFEKVFDTYKNTPLLDSFYKTYGHILTIFGNHLWKPLENIIKNLNIHRIVFIPHKELHLLPLHLIRSDESIFLCEKYEVCYTPNYNILELNSHQTIKNRCKQILVVENPDKSLHFAKPEANAIQSLFPQTTIVNGPDATKEKIRNNLGALSAIHFITHGVINDNEIQNVKLILADGELSFEDILANYRLRTCEFAFLSACKTGITKIDEGDEYIGLNHAFLYSGIKSVISSLWPVYDSSTMLFVHRWYYNKIKLKMQKSASLREAQLWLKSATWDDIKSFMKNDKLFNQIKKIHDDKIGFLDQKFMKTPFIHPYFWAPFCCYGNWS
jgi:CHAT domain-containing protein